MDRQFYVYTHARPDGSVFYVGKGSGRRAYDFSPSRRSRHHVNLVRKYGRAAIEVTVYPCESEDAAFALERRLISDFAVLDAGLINRTTGGEGAAGRTVSPATKEAFRKHYGPDRVPMSVEGKANMLEGLARGRVKGAAWRASPEGQAFVRTLGARSAAAMAARPPVEVTCQRCGGAHMAKKPTTRYCTNCSRNGARSERTRSQHPRSVPGEIPPASGGEGTL